MNAPTQRAWFFYQRRRYAEALDECRGALAADPHDRQALWRGGVCALILEQVDVAREMASSLLEVAPSSPESHELMAYVADVDDSWDAERHFLEALRQAPERAVLHAVFGNFLGRHGRIEDGITQAYQGLSLAPENPLVLRALEELFRFNDEPERADAMGRKALAADPEDADAHLAAGLRLLEARQDRAASATSPKRGASTTSPRRGASTHFREALRLEPADGDKLRVIAHERVRSHRFFRDGYFLPAKGEMLIVTLCVPLVWWLLSLLLAPLRYLAWISLGVVVAGYLYHGLFILCRQKVLRDLRRGQL